MDSSDISSGLLWYLHSNFHTGSGPLLVMTHLSSHLTAEYKTVPSERIGYISIWPYVALVGFYTSVCGSIVIQSLHLCLLEKRMMLFANWPHSSECQLHRCKIRQKLIKPCWGFQGLKPRFIIVNSFKKKKANQASLIQHLSQPKKFLTFLHTRRIFWYSEQWKIIYFLRKGKQDEMTLAKCLRYAVRETNAVLFNLAMVCT